MKKTKRAPAEESAIKLDMLAEQPTEEWDIARLRPHPKQAELIGSYSESEIRELAADISANGLKHSPEVLPDGCLIAGHRRKAALELLGRTTIPVIVRHDLAAEGEEAIEMHLIRDNLMRTHYHPLKIGRLYNRLKELSNGRGALTNSELGDLRDQLGKRLNKSGRTLDRYAAALRTPRAIQEAVERNELPMATAEAISRLSEADQSEIAQAIADSMPAKSAAAQYLDSQPASQPAAIGDRIAALARTLERSQVELLGRIDEIESEEPGIAEHLPIFTAIRDFLSQLIERVGVVDRGSCQAASGGRVR